ncbi:MAG: acyl-CoA dehydrogenase family protein [Actinobacteria bacterium]|nr:acyl-CoA dehydrogenase family protein [Actinomycetota bacterium]
MSMLARDLFEEEHHLYRESVRAFLAKEVVPHHAAWEEAGVVDRAVFERAGAEGHLCHSVEPTYGGAGVDDFRFPAILAEEQSWSLATGPFFSLHSDIVAPYIQKLGTAEQKQRWLPGMVAGTLIGAIAMTEPGAGSDLAGIATRAVRDGDHYVLNGSKTFTSNGQLADVVIVVARTSGDRHRGLTLLVVEDGMSGFARGRNLDKIGMKAQDTSELFFDDVRVPVTDRLGEEGRGFYYLVENLSQERLVLAINALGAIRRAFELTLTYVTQRTAFGQTIGSFQNTRFRLAEIATEMQIAQVFVDRCVAAHLDGELTAEQAAMAKWWTTELQLHTVNTGVQLHGGYGFMGEYPIAKLYVDSRAQTIYGGATEIMKELIGRSLGL